MSNQINTIIEILRVKIKFGDRTIETHIAKFRNRNFEELDFND